MSIRSPVFADHKPAERPGSLFGAAIGTPTGGLFGPYVVSPPRTPPTEENRYAQLPPEFHLDAAPPAVATAGQVGADPRPFIIAVAMASNCCFASPVAYQTHLIVYGAGGYRFSDFVKVGLPLNAATAVIALVVIPYVWPF